MDHCCWQQRQWDRERGTERGGRRKRRKEKSINTQRSSHWCQGPQDSLQFASLQWVEFKHGWLLEKQKSLGTFYSPQDSSVTMENCLSGYLPHLHVISSFNFQPLKTVLFWFMDKPNLWFSSPTGDKIIPQSFCYLPGWALLFRHKVLWLNFHSCFLSCHGDRFVSSSHPWHSTVPGALSGHNLCHQRIIADLTNCMSSRGYFSGTFCSTFQCIRLEEFCDKSKSEAPVWMNS